MDHSRRSKVEAFEVSNSSNMGEIMSVGRDHI
jgi:hypothetical protein